MKRILIGIVFFAVLAGVSYYYLEKNKEPEFPGGSDEYTIAVLSSDVFLKNKPDAAWEKITDSVRVGVGAEIKTSASGRAKILYPNGTITTIEGDSHVAISALASDGDKSRISLIFGSLWSKIQNILGTNDYYEVETGNIVASVRGTIFALEYRNYTSTVYGIGNTVQVTTKNATGSTVPSTSTQVASGEKIVVSGTPSGAAPISVVPITDTEINSGILERNLIEITDEEASNPWHEGLKELLKRLKKSTRSPSPTPTPAQSTSSAPSLTPTASLNPVIQSVSPKNIKVGQNFDILGSNFFSLTGARNVQSVFLDSTPVLFETVSSTTITANPGTLKAGTYTVQIVSTTGVKSTLVAALTIR